jgi:hypothetical protein
MKPQRATTNFASISIVAFLRAVLWRLSCMMVLFCASTVACFTGGGFDGDSLGAFAALCCDDYFSLF